MVRTPPTTKSACARALRSPPPPCGVSAGAPARGGVIRFGFAHVHGAVLEVVSEDASSRAVATVDGGFDEVRLKRWASGRRTRPTRGRRCPRRGSSCRGRRRRGHQEAAGVRSGVHAHAALLAGVEGDGLGRHGANLGLDALEVRHARGRGSRGEGKPRACPPLGCRPPRSSGSAGSGERPPVEGRERGPGGQPASGRENRARGNQRGG